MRDLTPEDVFRETTKENETSLAKGEIINIADFLPFQCHPPLLVRVPPLENSLGRMIGRRIKRLQELEHQTTSPIEEKSILAGEIEDLRNMLKKKI